MVVFLLKNKAKSDPENQRDQKFESIQLTWEGSELDGLQVTKEIMLKKNAKEKTESSESD